jgi:hypothetical protein
MRIPSEEVQALLISAPHYTRRPKRRSIDRMVGTLRTSMRRSIAQYLQAPMLLLDESIRVVLALEAYQYTRILKPESAPFALQLSRVRGDLLSIRELIVLGQESAALAVARVFLEDIEISMGIAIDPDFAVAYGDAEPYDTFWSKNIAYGRNNSRVQRFLEMGGGSDEQVAGKVQHHKELKNFLSGHVHPTHSSALRVAFPPALGYPGMFSVRPMGSIGANLSPLCLFLVDEVHSFSACCINILIRPEPPPALAGYVPNGELDDFVAAAHILQELSMKYLDGLREAHDAAQSAWRVALATNESET